MTLTFGSLFAGIGGFDLGLERAGMECRWQVEIDPFCQRVLEKHWPDVQRYGDITQLDFTEVEPVDLICGGFPCQDISSAGRRAGIDGTRSGLWSHYARCIRDLRPRYVLVENVSALLNRGMGRVLGDLATLGYDADWCCLSAADFGAPHLRSRVWIVGYPDSDQRRTSWPREVETGPARLFVNAGQQNASRSMLPNAHGEQYESRASSEQRQSTAVLFPYSGSRRHELPKGQIRSGRDRSEHSDWWATEPALGRVADGVPHRVDRLRSLGNAIVPQVAEWIGRRIVDAAA